MTKFEELLLSAQRNSPKMALSPDRIDYDERGDLDDVVVCDVSMFRMERMASGQFWLRCYRDGKPDVVFNLISSRKITGNHHFD